RVEPSAVDAHRFQALAAEGAAALRAGDTDAAAEALGCALALWWGAPLPDAGEFAATHVIRLADLRLTAQLDRVEAELARDRAVGVVSELEALTVDHPLHERVAALW